MPPAADDVLAAVDRLVVVAVVDRELAERAEDEGEPEGAEERVLRRLTHDGPEVGRVRQVGHHPAADREEQEPEEQRERVGGQRPPEARLAVAEDVGLVPPHRKADHDRDAGEEREPAAALRVVVEDPGVAHQHLDHEIDDPDDDQRRHEVAREHGDAREAEEVVDDHQAGEDDRQQLDVAPAVETVPDLNHQPRLEAGPAGRADDDEDRDEPRARDAEDRARQERVRLAGARAEVGRRHRVRDVDPDPEYRDHGRRAEVVTAGVELGADEEEREAGGERCPEPGEVPDRAAPVERHDAGVARRIVVPDRLVERLALEREVLPELRDVVRDLLTRMVVKVPRARRHRQSPCLGWASLVTRESTRRLGSLFKSTAIASISSITSGR